ncbi:MarR family winged helix-turn-helix transcriptional regulator [Herbiconiux sp. P15]|uniref:MarR family winged helix-turn-helix transcriptional regulator n=1 Tax=Herbiconiux liukaitaii TaxID=3342799 RepID=UPI0035B7E78F
MSEPRWLDDQEADAWLQLLSVFEYLPGAIETQLKRDSGLGRFEYSVLAMASGSPGRSIAMLQLSELANGSLSRLSHTVTRLAERGLVTRTQKGGTRYVTLTELGWETLQAAAPGHVDEVRRLVFDHLPEDSAAQLAELLRPIAENLRRSAPRS